MVVTSFLFPRPTQPEARRSSGKLARTVAGGDAGRTRLRQLPVVAIVVLMVFVTLYLAFSMI